LRLAALDVSGGRLTAARMATDSAVSIADKAKLESSRQRARLAGLAIAFAQADPKAGAALKDFAVEELHRMDASASTYDLSSITHLTFAAMLALRNGDHPLADRILTALKAKAEGSGYFSLEQPYRTLACEATIEKEPAQAVSCLEALTSDRSYYQHRVALLRAYRAAARNDEARAAAVWLAQHRGLATAEFLGEFAGQIPNLIASDAAWVDAAELNVKAGNKDDARKVLGQFADAWKNAEGEPPLLQRARRLQSDLLAH